MNSPYETVDLRGRRPLVNGRPLPRGMTMSDWMQLHASPGFYYWLNAIRGCGKPPSPWRYGSRQKPDLGWCGV